MPLHIKYFGMIAEATNVQEEYIEIDNCTTAELLDQLIVRYPQFKNMDCKVAIDHKIATMNDRITSESEIALLPPFAGG